MGPEEGAEVSEETPAETSGGPVESASGGQAGVSGDQTAAQTESSEAERATEIVGETMVQGGNATAGKDYMTPAPEAAGDEVSGAGGSGSSSVTGGSGSTSGADGAASGAGSSASTGESTASAPAGQTASDEPVTEVNAQGQRIYTIKEGETLHGICYKSVSYTHLDVYKRQVALCSRHDRLGHGHHVLISQLEALALCCSQNRIHDDLR